MADADLADTLLWLCSIASPIGEEQALCDAVAERIGKVLLAGPIRRHGDSLVVPLVRNSGRPHLVLAGHLDVVRTAHDGPARIEGDKLYGAGAADMKSGLALMFDIAEKRERPNLDLTLVFYAREEGPYAENELGRVLAEDPEVAHADLAIALEPSDNKLQLGCGGSLHATVAFSGRTAHSARPWQGDNAVHKAGQLLNRLAALQPETEEVDGLEWKSVISATMASGGRARNVIPDRFELNLNHRFGPRTSISQAKANVEALVAGEAEVTFTDLSPSAPPHRDNAWIAALADSGVLAIEPKQAWTDVARFHEAGVAAANFGPGTQAQAHQRNEWTYIPGLATGRDILARWFARIGGPLALVLGMLTASGTSACNEVGSVSSRRSDAVADAMTNAPSFFERAELVRRIATLRSHLGSTTRVLVIDVRDDRLTAQVQNPTKRGEVLEYTMSGDTFGEPRPAELRGTGELETNLFPLRNLALERIPELVTAAATQVDPEAGKVTRVLIRRQLPNTDAVRFRVYVDSPRVSGHADFDSNGNPVLAGAQANSAASKSDSSKTGL
jgi:succinyl-diaminopimelate desuccinylase